MKKFNDFDCSSSMLRRTDTCYWADYCVHCSRSQHHTQGCVIENVTLLAIFPCIKHTRFYKMILVHRKWYYIKYVFSDAARYSIEDYVINIYVDIWYNSAVFLTAYPCTSFIYWQLGANLPLFPRRYCNWKMTCGNSFDQIFPQTLTHTTLYSNCFSMIKKTTWML